MKISAVSFDLTGTLLKPFPSLGELCVQAMQAQKIEDIPAAEIFNARQNDARSRAQLNGHAPVSEERSKDYWRAMLWEIFAGACTNEQFKIAEAFIYNALAQPEHWQLMPYVRETLEFLQFIHVPAVVISNGDSRWKKALDDKELTPFFKKIFISAKTGFSKPSEAAFDHVCRSLKIARNELLHIGDTMSDDIVPAINFGANAIWVTAHPSEIEKKPEQVEYFSDLKNVGLCIRDLIASGEKNISHARNTQQLLARLDNRQLEDNGAPRLYCALDPQKEIAISSKFIARSEERRAAGDDNVRHLADIVPAIIQKRGLFKGSIQETLGEIWHECVPANLANRCHPDDLKDNFTTLYVRCDSAATMQEFAFQKARILKKLKANPACAKLKNLVPVC